MSYFFNRFFIASHVTSDTDHKNWDCISTLAKSTYVTAVQADAFPMNRPISACMHQCWVRCPNHQNPTQSCPTFPLLGEQAGNFSWMFECISQLLWSLPCRNITHDSHIIFLQDIVETLLIQACEMKRLRETKILGKAVQNSIDCPCPKKLVSILQSIVFL